MAGNLLRYLAGPPPRSQADVTERPTWRLSGRVGGLSIPLVSTLIELILVDHDLRCWQAVIPKDDQTLKRELLRNFLSHLGVDLAE